MRPRAVFFPNLDAWRACCFLAVFFSHSYHTASETIKAMPVYHFVKKELFENGKLGVNFFFVLSGFLITYLLLTEKRETGRIHIPQFYLRRVLRIWPLYYFCVFFGFVLFPFFKAYFGGHPEETARLAYYLTFTSNFDVVAQNGMPDSSVLSVLWSVGVEEQFYLAWPLLLTLVPSRWYPILFGSVLSISLGFCALNADDWGVLWVHTLACMGDLCIGAIGAYWMLDERKRKRAEALPRWSIALVYVLFAVCFFFRDEALRAVPALWSVDRLVIAVLILFIIIEQNYAERSLFKLGRFKWLSALGRISYGLYCLHFIGILVTLTLTERLGWNQHFWQIFFIEVPVSLAITIAISHLSYRFYERPFLKLKERFTFVRSGVPGPGASAVPER